MKKTFSLIIALLVLLFTVSTAFADTDIYTHEALEYTIGDGTITIVGCYDNEETVEVPALIAGIPVNTIAAGAFTSDECSNVKYVILPDTISKVEGGAFRADIVVTQKAGDSDVDSGDAGDNDVIVIQDGALAGSSQGSDDVVAYGEDGSVYEIPQAEGNIEDEDIVGAEGDVLVAGQGIEDGVLSDDGEATYQEGSSNLLIILIIVVVALGIIGVAVALVIKKRNDGDKKPGNNKPSNNKR